MEDQTAFLSKVKDDINRILDMIGGEHPAHAELGVLHDEIAAVLPPAEEPAPETAAGTVATDPVADTAAAGTVETSGTTDF